MRGLTKHLQMQQQSSQERKDYLLACQLPLVPAPVPAENNKWEHMLNMKQVVPEVPRQNINHEKWILAQCYADPCV
jgi:hypothetical protein